MGKLGALEMALLIPALILYFVPTIIAASRRHSNTTGIVLLNIFLGWTFLGWIASFIWSLTNPGRTQQHIVVNNNYSETDNRNTVIDDLKSTQKSGNYDSKIEHLQKLKNLHDSGVLSDEEFASEKAKILQS